MDLTQSCLETSMKRKTQLVIWLKNKNKNLCLKETQIFWEMCVTSLGPLNKKDIMWDINNFLIYFLTVKQMENGFDFLVISLKFV